MSEKQTKPDTPKILRCPVDLIGDKIDGWILKGDMSIPECQKTYDQIYKILGPNARRLLDRHTVDTSSKKK